MTNERMIQLAYNGALMIWGHLEELLERCPEDEGIKRQERKAWEELSEMHEKMLELEGNKQ